MGCTSVTGTMISQHLQTVILPAVASRQLLSMEDAARAIAEIQEFIALRPDAREARKALAVKLISVRSLLLVFLERN